MAKDSMHRRRLQLMDALISGARSRGEPAPSNAKLDMWLSCWKRARWAPVRSGVVMGKVIGS
jgi:hypothetical protein